jgi:hypothetical protein
VSALFLAGRLLGWDWREIGGWMDMGERSTRDFGRSGGEEIALTDTNIGYKHGHSKRLEGDWKLRGS